MNVRNAPERRADGGFVLIGVVMFVLALTILGLSLFSLSSYEGQFMNRSLDETRAFYLAQGGLERAKAVLAVPSGRLEDVKLSLPYEGVSYAVASQRRSAAVVDTTGPLDWSGDTVTVRVLARLGRSSRMLEAQFRPESNQNYYKRLFTLSGTDPLDMIAQLHGGPGGGTDRTKPRLSGQVWSRSDSTTWLPNVDWPSRPWLKRDPLPDPDIAGFLAGHAPTDTCIWEDSTSNLVTIRMEKTPGTSGFFWDPLHGDPDHAGQYFNYTKASIFKVQGTAVLLLPAGMRMDARVRIEGSGPNPTLVIVAGPNGVEPGDADAGIWFFGGLEVDPAVNLVLVTNGRVKLEYFNNDDPSWTNNTLANVSIFARRLFLLGPKDVGGSSKHLDLRHPSTMDAVIDGLLSDGALPNATGGGNGQLALIRGTWRDLTP